MDAPRGAWQTEKESLLFPDVPQSGLCGKPSRLREDAGAVARRPPQAERASLVGSVMEVVDVLRAWTGGREQGSAAWLRGAHRQAGGCEPAGVRGREGRGLPQKGQPARRHTRGHGRLPEEDTRGPGADEKGEVGSGPESGR